MSQSQNLVASAIRRLILHTTLWEVMNASLEAEEGPRFEPRSSSMRTNANHYSCNAQRNISYKYLRLWPMARMQNLSNYGDEQQKRP